MASALAPFDLRRRRAALFALAAMIGAFDLASLFYLRRESTDFIAARRFARAGVYLIGTRLSWRGQAPGAAVGWAPPEPPGTWSTRRAAVLELRLAGKPPSDLVLTVTAIPFRNDRVLPVRRVAVEANGAPVGTWRFDESQSVDKSVRIPRALIDEHGALRVTLRFAEYVSPRGLDLGPDERRLGILVHEWRLDAAP